MRLKTLEIRGFKSFADKTVINFSENVIGVVGSNGCGKSNIVDAMRWVLGEQKTSQLRSESMTNVIFNGTKVRKAAGFSEVSLIFENNKGVLPTEYQEVAIRRTLFQDGSSEYRLNDVKCRLKDIQNLLGDTGMESSSYAIIALDMVDDLLQDKDNARLRLFEQASGIAKYKVRKKETMQKLDSTEADLLRVEDLLAEIDQNLKTLEKQAKRAQKYLELKKEYRQCSVEWAFFRLDSLRQSRANLSEQLEKESQAAEKLDIEIHKLEESIEKEKFDNIEKEKALAEAQRQLNRCVSNLKTKENEAKMLEQKLQFSEQSKEKLLQRIKEAQTQSEFHAKNEAQYRGSLQSEEEILKLLQQEFSAAQQQLQTYRQQNESLKKELETIAEQRQHNQRIVIELEKKIAIQQHQTDTARQQQQQAAQNLETRRKENEQWHTRLAQLEKEQEAVEAKIEQLRASETERRRQITEAETALETLRDQLQQKNRSLDAQRNEYKLLKSWVENLEGYSESIKFLSKSPQWTAAPLLSDVLSCAPEYQKCIENYLDTYLSYYVVKDADEALKAIALLDQNKKGKANFFLSQQVPAAAQTQAPAGAVSAMEVIEADEAYRPLIAFLLNNVYIVDSPQNIDNQASSQHIWITKDGKYARRRFSLHGGSVAVVEAAKIGRKKTFERLQDSINQLEIDAQQLQRQLQAQQAHLQQLRQTDYQTQIQRSEQQLNQLVRDLTSSKSKLEQFAQLEQETQQRQQQLATYIEQLHPQIAENKAQLVENQRKANEIQQDFQKKETELRQQSETLTQHNSAFNQKNIELVRQQNKISTLQRELEYSLKQIQELNTQVERENASLVTIENEMLQTRRTFKQNKTDIEDATEEKWDLQQLVQNAEKTYFESKGSIASVEENLRRCNKTLQQHVQLGHQLENKLNELKLQNTALSERMKIEFEIDIEEIFANPPTPTLNEQQLEAEMENLRKKVAGYGSVNHMAIEAYQEIKERNDFIQVQREDLLKAKNVLLETINEIEQAATMQFMQAFTLIRGHFIRVFRSLFSQDDICDLVLTLPDQPLESHVEIVANPKGKKPLTINQLSGGEKTLTATALLFAVYLLKPAPFCIFDEVDAPLDDANIAKFNNIIREFSKESQFIIVTHNKKSMETVDILYGVTMVEGISKVVPVDFRQWKTTEEMSIAPV